MSDASSTPPGAEPGSTRTVLVCDDSRFFRSMMCYALSEDGLRPLAAGSGEEALELLGRELPDVHLLLLDLVMPGLNGFELLEKLRAVPGAAQLPVVVVSQYVLNQLEKDILRKHGVTTVLTKSAAVERILFQVRDELFPEERERRLTPRVPITLAVTVRTPRSTHITSTFNLSETGMFLVLPEEEAPPPGSEVLIKFWVPDEASVFQVPSRVAWVNAVGASFRRTHPPGFGVEYVARNPETRDAIRRFLRSQA